MEKKLIVFLDSGDTIIDESTEVRDDEGIVLHAELIPGADVMVKTLFDKGYTLALVADGDAQSFKNVFKQHGLYDYFTTMIYSETVKASKPSPRMFKAAVGALDLSEADIPHRHDWQQLKPRYGANALGITSIFFQSWTPRYPHTPADETERPTFTVREPLELVRIIG